MIELTNALKIYLRGRGERYFWSVPIGNWTNGGFDVWIAQVVRILISVGMGITFIRLGSSIYKVVFGMDENSLTEEKKKAMKSGASLVLLVLSSLIVGAISPYI